MRLCPRRLTSPLDRVGKVARGQRALSSTVAGDFAHPTPDLSRSQNRHLNCAEHPQNADRNGFAVAPDRDVDA
jgi:hypothetical protein